MCPLDSVSQTQQKDAKHHTTPAERRLSASLDQKQTLSSLCGRMCDSTGSSIARELKSCVVSQPSKRRTVTYCLMHGSSSGICSTFARCERRASSRRETGGLLDPHPIFIAAESEWRCLGRCLEGSWWPACEQGYLLDQGIL